MAREKPHYRETLDRLNEMFPGKEVLSRKELCAFLGRSPRFVYDHWRQHYNKQFGGYSKTKIASELVS